MRVKKFIRYFSEDVLSLSDDLRKQSLDENAKKSGVYGKNSIKYCISKVSIDI